MSTEVIALIVAIVSLILATFFSAFSLMNATRAKEISENQRTAALISMLSPACKDPEAWTLFIKYLSSHNRLPAFSEDEEKFVQKMLLRLDIKESIVSGGRIQLPEPQDE